MYIRILFLALSIVMTFTSLNAENQGLEITVADAVTIEISDGGKKTVTLSGTTAKSISGINTFAVNNLVINSTKTKSLDNNVNATTMTIIPNLATPLNEAVLNPSFQVYQSNRNEVTVVRNRSLKLNSWVSIYNTLGQRIVSSPIIGGQKVFKNFTKPGVYLITIESGGRKTVSKLMINNI